MNRELKRKQRDVPAGYDGAELEPVLIGAVVDRQVILAEGVANFAQRGGCLTCLVRFKSVRDQLPRRVDCQGVGGVEGAIVAQYFGVVSAGGKAGQAD